MKRSRGQPEHASKTKYLTAVQQVREVRAAIPLPHRGVTAVPTLHALPAAALELPGAARSPHVPWQARREDEQVKTRLNDESTSGADFFTLAPRTRINICKGAFGVQHLTTAFVVMYSWSPLCWKWRQSRFFSPIT